MGNSDRGGSPSAPVGLAELLVGATSVGDRGDQAIASERLLGREVKEDAVLGENDRRRSVRLDRASRVDLGDVEPCARAAVGREDLDDSAVEAHDLAGTEPQLEHASMVVQREPSLESVFRQGRGG
jgi:hypothetical protein